MSASLANKRPQIAERFIAYPRGKTDFESSSSSSLVGQFS